MADDTYECENCLHQAPRKDLPEAEDIVQRLQAGDTFTDKECPMCTALCYPVDPTPPPLVEVQRGDVEDIIEALKNNNKIAKDSDEEEIYNYLLEQDCCDVVFRIIEEVIRCMYQEQIHIDEPPSPSLPEKEKPSENEGKHE